MSMRYPGGIISATAPTVTTTSAKGVWTLEQVAQYVKAGTWPVPIVEDLYFQYNSLLLPGTGTNGAQNNTFLDSSSSPFSITRNGNTTQGTFSPFSQTGWSVYFGPGSNEISVGSNAALAPGTSDFCFECWIYATTAFASSYSGLYVGPGTTDGIFIGQLATGLFGVRSRGNVDILSQTSPSINTWVHIAVTRSGTSLRMFYNGVQQGSTVTDSTNFVSGATTVGSSSFNFYGYISNARFVKGSAVYTSNFTPSTSPLTAITNTQLLTCQSNRFVDNSINAFAITPSGTPSIQAFSPFNPTAAWSSSTNGGSGYFDGTGDYLSVSSLTFNPRTTVFTVEGWFYRTAGTTVAFFGAATSTNFYVSLSGNNFYVGDGSLNTISAAGTGGPLGAWEYIAMSFDGTTYRLYQNGVLIGSSTTLLASNTVPLSIGAYSNGLAPLTGYSSGVRFSNTARYTGSTMTVPTAPFTNDVNTSLLCNFTNAGIYDAAAKNDLETVGNAQISTAQSKFGGSSIAFDGTGDWLVGYQTVLYNMGSGDFTVEFWVNTTTTSSGACLVGATTGGGGTNTQWGIFQGYASSTSIDVYLSNGSSYFANTGGGNVTDGNWHHVAFTRYGASGKLFLDGVQVGSTLSLSTTALAPENKPIYVGSQGGSYPFTGYIDDLRITKGVARYTTNFTPPSTAFPLF